MAGMAIANRPISGAPAIIRARTRDNGLTFDAQTIDSAGAFLVGELERLDQNLHMPLASVTWSRDINLREDVSIADELSSFTNSSFAAAGGASPNGKSWIGKDASAISGIALDIGKTSNPLALWGMQLGWTLPELASAEKLGRPVDKQKYDGMMLKYNMDIDEQVYIGDAGMGVEGLLNSSKVTASNVANGAGGSPLWANKSPKEILDDVNKLLNDAWAASGFAVCPSKVLLPPLQFSSLATRFVSDAGTMSILQYVKENSVCMNVNGRPLDIQPVKWAVNRGAGGTNRMAAYSQEQDRVRFPLVPLQRTPVEFRDLRQLTTYFGRLGVTEFVYPETVAYADGI